MFSRVRSLATTAFRRVLSVPSPTTPGAAEIRSLASSKLPHVAIFWDLDNKPPNSIPPSAAASRLHFAASRFGPVRLAVAYANSAASRRLAAPVRAIQGARLVPDRVEDAGVLAPAEPLHSCGVCCRRFRCHSALVNHFRQIHEREQAKRVARLASARGGRRVRLAAELSGKMEKYRRAAQDVLVPRFGYRLAEELRRAGVVVREVEDRSQAADRALREHMVDAIDGGLVGCLVLVSDDAGFAGVLRKAKMRCLRTVVIGDEKGKGVLKRIADAGFSWQEVASGKASKEAPTVMGRWKDRELLERLEWSHRLGKEHLVWNEEESFDALETESEDDGSEGDSERGGVGLAGKTVTGDWRDLESSEVICSAK